MVDNNLSRIKMFHFIPEHYHNLSLRLSEVLDDIGVNERMVKKRRRLALLLETSTSLVYSHSAYIFGSTSEGTTTTGLNSDIDTLYSLARFNVIKDYADWKPGLLNLLMIQDDITSPGYCHLQLIRSDMPLPLTESLNGRCVCDAQGRILLKNTIFDHILLPGMIKHGPAKAREGRDDIVSTDSVFAMSCESWPTEARDWSQRVSEKWPTEDMKRYIENSGCFVVPVESKISQIEQLEWRISTSKAERCLMFNLNITQIRCFVLLKMILGTYLQHPLSSYMCKTVLLRSIEKTHYKMWQAKNLFTCLTVCLQALYGSILHESCPHYFIPGNNLMARQFSPRMKDKLLTSLHDILGGRGAALYGIQIDALGERLKIKMNPLYQYVQSPHLLSADDICLMMSKNIVSHFANDLFALIYYVFIEHEDTHLGSPIAISECLMQAILNFLRLYKNGTNIERKTLQFLVPLYCSSLGSVLASVDIGTNHSLSPEAFNWLSAGSNSDVSSGRLKLASVLYCAGDMLRAASILRETEMLYRLDSVEPGCNCHIFANTNYNREYSRACYIQDVKAIKKVYAFCVRFFSAEMNCIPRELKYELFRSTEEELLQRDGPMGDWMGTAVVDSLPFLYFLQYKIYGKLQSYNDQQKALEQLALTVSLRQNFGHRETAFNLLGQCYEQENRLNDALVCYKTSLDVRGTNNVARFHLCRLLADMQNN